MNTYVRLRSDGALSIDLEEATGGSSTSNIFLRGDDDNVRKDAANISCSPIPRYSDMWLGNVSSSTGSPRSLPQHHSSPALPAESGVRKQLVQEEWRENVHLCMSHQTTEPLPGHVATSLSSTPTLPPAPPAPVVGETKLRELVGGEMVLGNSPMPSSPSRCRSSQTIFEKLFAHARTQGEKQELLRAAREGVARCTEKENRPDTARSVSSLRLRRTATRSSGCGGGDGVDDDETGKVFERLYADAERLRRKQEMLRRHREEKMRQETKSAILVPESQRRQRQLQSREGNSGQPLVRTQAVRAELFERLAMPTQRSREKRDSAFTGSGTAAGALDEKKGGRGSGSRRVVLQWPLLSLTTFTLADLRRHNEIFRQVLL